MKRTFTCRSGRLFLLILLSLIFSGCLTFKSVADLKNDKLNEDAGFNAILIIDLEIQDYSSLLPTYGNPSIWEFYKGDIQSEKRMAQYIIPGEWSQSNNSYILQKVIELQTISGTHKISNISFTRNQKTFRYKLFRQYEVLPKAITYLGKIKLINNINGSYQINIKPDKISRRIALTKFQSKYPFLYQKYRNNIVTAKTRTITKVSW